MRIRLKASSVLIALGTLLSLAMAVSGLTEAQRAASPFDQVDTPAPPSQGFDPMMVPQAALAGPRGAPTLLPQTSDLKQALQMASPPRVLPPSPSSTWQDPAAGEGLPRTADSVPSPISDQTAIPAVTPITWPDPAAGEAPLPTLTPTPMSIPDRVVIPAIQLDAPVIWATLKDIENQGRLYRQWVAPNAFASGWLTTSAPLGAVGNTVLIGHHNIRGEVFGHLADLKAGDLIWIYSGPTAFVYHIVLILLLPERWQPVEVRLANAQWILPSLDERLTLVTCWPYASNTHRLIIVATPANPEAIKNDEIIPRLTPHPPVN